MALILLGADNKVLQESITSKLQAAKKEPCDAKLYDFDDVFYRIFIDPENRSKMLISLETPNWGDVRSKGSEAWIKESLGEYVKSVNNDGVQFEINLDDEKCSEKASEIGSAFSKLRILALGGPLYEYCKALNDGKPLKAIFDYKFRRDTHLWIAPLKDRVVCVFGFEFPIKSDRILANQILSEFLDVRRQKDVQNTPVLTFSKHPPNELKGAKIPPFDKEAFLGYFSVLLLPGHIKGNKITNAVEQVIGLRAYLTYHIKCAKAYFHQSMRARVKLMLQVLNRARYEPDDERKKKKIIKGAR